MALYKHSHQTIGHVDLHDGREKAVKIQNILNLNAIANSNRYTAVHYLYLADGDKLIYLPACIARVCLYVQRERGRERE